MFGSMTYIKFLNRNLTRNRNLFGRIMIMSKYTASSFTLTASPFVSMRVQGLIDGIQVSLSVCGPVFYQVVYSYLDKILNEHPYEVVCPDKTDQNMTP